MHNIWVSPFLRDPQQRCCSFWFSGLNEPKGGALEKDTQVLFWVLARES